MKYSNFYFFRKKFLFVMISPLLLTKGYSQNDIKIIYNLKLGLINGGTATMIKKDTLYNSKKCIYYLLEGNTKGLTDKIFSVHEKYESIVDASTHLPYVALRKAKERSYQYYNKVFFYRENDSIYSERTGGKKVPKDLTDILSVFFYFVNTYDMDKMEEGNAITIPTINGHKIDDLKITFVKNQVLKNELGTEICYLLTPKIKKGKVLKSSDGLKFYLSQKEKIPIQIEIETKVGTLKAVPVEMYCSQKPLKLYCSKNCGN